MMFEITIEKNVPNINPRDETRKRVREALASMEIGDSFSVGNNWASNHPDDHPLNMVRAAIMETAWTFESREDMRGVRFWRVA